MHPLALKGSTLWQGMHYVAAIFCTARPSIVRGAESRCDKMHPPKDQSGGAKYRRDTFFRVTPVCLIIDNVGRQMSLRCCHGIPCCLQRHLAVQTMYVQYLT
jgi:hypothetical protein